MADKDLRRRATPVFPRTRSSTNDATSRSDYDLKNRLLSAGGTDPLAELERLVGEIDSFVKTRADAGRGSEVNNFDASRGYTEEPSPATPRNPDDFAKWTAATPPVEQRYKSPSDYSLRSDVVEKDVDAQIYDEADAAGGPQHEAEYYDDERGITDRQYDREAD